MLINFIHIPKNGGTSVKKLTSKRFQKNTIVYNGHRTDVYKDNLPNQLVIIRNPIDRFASSVYYAIQKWSHEPQIKYLISKKIDTPEKWVQIWSDPKHPDHENLMREMINKTHFIGDTLNEFKWTYSPQSLWINNPRFVVIMDNLEAELQYLRKKYKLRLTELRKRNSTQHTDDRFSKESIDFLQGFYRADFAFYEKIQKHEQRRKIVNTCDMFFLTRPALKALISILKKIKNLV